MALVIICVFGFLGGALAVVSSRTVSASATIGLRDPRGVSLVRSAGSTSTDLTRYTSERADFARSAAVVSRAAQIDGQVRENELRDRLTTSASATADVIKLTVTAKEPVRARDLANAAARAFDEEQKRNVDIQVQELSTELDNRKADVIDELNTLGAGPAADAQRAALGEVLRDLETRRTDLGVEASTFGSGVEFIDDARLPTEKVLSTDLVRNTLAGLIFGVFVAMFVAWLRASSSRIVDRSDVALAKLKLPVLGEIPAYGSQTMASAQSFTNLPLLEYQFVASNVSMRISKGVVVMAGIAPGDGTTTSATNIAAAAAVNGQRVALVDGDVRDAGLTRLLGWPIESGGVLDVLEGRATIADVATPVAVAGGASITVVAAGSSGAGRRDLLTSERMWSLLDELRDDYDLIIVDAPPVLSMPDAVSLAVHADALAIVLRRGTPSADVDRLHHQIDMLSERTIGFVFTRSSVSEIPGEDRVRSEGRGVS